MPVSLKMRLGTCPGTSRITPIDNLMPVGDIMRVGDNIDNNTVPQLFSSPYPWIRSPCLPSAINYSTSTQRPLPDSAPRLDRGGHAAATAVHRALELTVDLCTKVRPGERERRPPKAHRETRFVAY